MTSLLPSLVDKTFDALQGAKSIYAHIPEETLKGAFPDAGERTPESLYGKFGLDAYGFTKASAGLSYCRRLVPIVLGEFQKKQSSQEKLNQSALQIISGLVCARLGYAECGESNLVAIANFYKDREYDGLLLDCFLCSRLNSSNTHAFSILVPRKNACEIELDKDLTLKKLKDSIPDGILIDSYFKEAARLGDIESECPKFLKYTCWLRNFKFNLAGIYDSRNTELRLTSSKIEEVADVLHGLLKEISHPECPHLTKIESLYKRDIEKIRAKCKMKKSGSFIFSYVETTNLQSVCLKLDRLKVEYFVNPPLPRSKEMVVSSDLLHFFIVYP